MLENILIKHNYACRSDLSLRDWTSIIRPVNGIMGIVGTLISSFIGLGYGITGHYAEAFVAALSVFLVTSGGNVINDIYDRETDRINHPERPIPGGRISVSSARVFSAALFAVPILLAFFFLNYEALTIVVIAEILLIVYESNAKRRGLSGNIIVGSLVGLIFIFGGISVGSAYKMYILFVMAALTNIGREITKDVEDMTGDVDRKTFPKQYGKKNSAYLVTALVLIAVAASFIPYIIHIFTFYYLIPVVVADALFIYTASMVQKDPSKSQKYSKYAMILGLLSFIVGEIA